jgi:ankyrin repeat protein
MLEANKYLVYEYDHLLMTTLHWCAMRGLETTAKILLKYGADPDS